MPSSSSNSSGAGRRRGTLLIAGLALLLIGVVVAIVKMIQGAPTASEEAAGGDGGAGAPPAAVFAAAVVREDAQYEAIVTGTLRAVSRAEVAAQEAEAVAEIFVDDGDEVAKGDRLVSLDDRRVRAQRAAAGAQLQSARELVSQREAELERAQSDREMKEGLMRDKVGSRSDFLDAEREVAVAVAQHDAAVQAVTEAESLVELLEIRRADLEIKAPFAGVIAERHVEPGEWVSSGQAVMTLVSIDPVEAWMSVPERYLSDLTDHPEGIRVRLSSSGDLFQPTEVTIVPDVEVRSQLFTVVATVANPRGQLAPGQSITGIVPVGERESHWVIPVDALVRARAGEFIFVADGSGEAGMPVARKVEVKVHFERGEEAYVRIADADLKETDRVVVEGNDRLQAGQPLLVEEVRDAAERRPEL